MKGPFFPAHEIIVACTLPPVTSEVYPGEEEEHSGTNMKGTFFLRLTGYIFKDLNHKKSIIAVTFKTGRYRVCLT